MGTARRGTPVATLARGPLALGKKAAGDPDPPHPTPAAWPVAAPLRGRPGALAPARRSREPGPRTRDPDVPDQAGEIGADAGEDGVAKPRPEEHRDRDPDRTRGHGAVAGGRAGSHGAGAHPDRVHAGALGRGLRSGAPDPDPARSPLAILSSAGGDVRQSRLSFAAAAWVFRSRWVEDGAGLGTTERNLGEPDPAPTPCG